jgi:hypothetical protein
MLVEPLERVGRILGCPLQEIQVTATTSLDAAVPGTGAIIYSGNPSQVTTSITGTGTIARG